MQYTIKVANIMGEASATAELSMTCEPPELGESLPATTKIAEGETLKLVAKVSGSPLPEVKWYKDNEEVIPDERTTIQLLPDGTAILKIANALPQDSGNYKMVAENSSGKVATQTCADVKKLPKKGTIDTSLPGQVKVTQGQPLKLTAKISGHPKPEIQWMKDGRPIRAGGRAILSTLPDGTVSLEIDLCNPEDAGKYTLTVSNNLGESVAESNVEIEPPPSTPQFISPLFPVKGTEGFPIKMEAKVVGYPTPEITWMKGGKKFKPDKARMSASKKPDADGIVSLSIEQIVPEDAGQYTVTARNPEGENSSSGKLDVRPRQADGPPTAPFFITQPRDVNVDEGDPIRLSAAIGGNPIPEIQWTLNGDPVETGFGPDKVVLSFDGDKLSLEIPKAHKNNEGEYQVALTNDSGAQSAKAKVGVRKIYSRPSFTQKFTDMQQLPTYDAKFVAKVTGNPRPNISWTFQGREILGDCDRYKIKRDGDICALFVRDCDASRAGRYACIATNSEGQSMHRF